MKTSSSRRANPEKRRGLSLVLVLFAILALSFLVVLYFTLARDDRAGTAAYTNAIRADELGVGGLEMVIEELRKEISDPSRSSVDSNAQGGPTLYVPSARANLLPERTVSGTAVNLLKKSARTVAFFTGTEAGLMASAASTTTPSRNGRSVPLHRWARPELGDFTTTSLPAPDWIFLGRDGVVTDPLPADAADFRSAGFVIGRMAFAVYDIGGLLDLNVAGYPAELAPEEAGRKGSTALARLQSFGLTDTAVESLMAFRNPASRPNYATYLASGTHHAFTRTLPGDNRFLSRQELIRFARRKGFDAKLPFFTVFSREKNAPSYTPDSPTAVNPSLLSLRHQATGRPLFGQRFALSRLALFQDPAANAADILKYFGLTYDANTRSFSYKAPTLKTATQIAQESDWREPDFFELLKAAIGSGSVGQSAGTTAMVADDPDKDAHIMQIGANIIDQYDLDPDTNSSGPIPIPTTIQFGAKTLYGTEDLPYVNKIHFLGENAKSLPVSEDVGNLAVGYENNQKNTDSYSFLASVELWNPNFQRLANAGSDPAPEIRISMTGRGQVTMYPSNNAEPSGTGAGVGINTPPFQGAEEDLTSMRNIKVNQNLGSYLSYNYFSEPHHVRMDTLMAPLLYNKLIQQAGNPDYRNFCFNSAKVALPGGITVTLSVLDKDGIPRPYQQTLRTSLNELKISETSTPNAAASRVGATSSFAHSDPRTNRLGYFGLNFRPSNAEPIGAQNGSPGLNPRGSLPQFYTTAFAPNTTTPFSLRPRFDKFGCEGDPNGFGIATTDGMPQQSYSPLSTGLYLGLLWENTKAATRVQDPDGTYRMGDGGFAPGNTIPTPFEPIQLYYASPVPWPTDGSRTAGTNASRPVMLNRPFRSVADLGYVYRDIPWRSLNFSGTDSADAALLDAFSIEDGATVAGRVNMNSAHPEVLQSLISGSVKEEKTYTSQLTDIEALASAGRLGQFAATAGPLKNIAELVTVFSTPANLTTAELGSSSTGEPSPAIKTQRESLIRALAGSTQTRTWNLLIDLVAQTGRFSPNAQSLDDFVVEGERRYWLHVAIDRYTGEVVSELLETVNE